MRGNLKKTVQVSLGLRSRTLADRRRSLARLGERLVALERLILLNTSDNRLIRGDVEALRRLVGQDCKGFGLQLP